MITRKFTQMILVSLLIISFALASCSTTKIAALDCPPIASNKSNKFSSNHRKAKNNTHLFAYNRNKRINNPGSSKRESISQKTEITNSYAPTFSGKGTKIESFGNLTKAEFSKGLIASNDNTLIPLRVSNDKVPSKTAKITVPIVLCDTMVLKNGSTIVGKVEEIGQTEIKYRKCNNLSGPLIAIPRFEVSEIFYSNGMHDQIVSENTPLPTDKSVTTDNDGAKQIDGFAIGGFIAGVAGLFVFPIIFGAAAIVFGAISLSRMKKNPDKYYGKGFAIASVVLGIVGIVGALIIAATYY